MVPVRPPDDDPVLVVVVVVFVLVVVVVVVVVAAVMANEKVLEAVSDWYVLIRLEAMVASIVNL